MYDKKKIALMTKLAVYDKNFAEEDLRNDQYFRHDYIYKRNMRNRIFVFLGCIIVILLSVLHKMVYEDFDIYAINYTVELTKIVIFFAVMLIAYTVVGTIIYTAEFHKSQKRLDRYFHLLGRLDRYNAAVEKRKKALAHAEHTEYDTGEDANDDTDDKTNDDSEYEEEDIDTDDGTNDDTDSI